MAVLQYQNPTTVDAILDSVSLGGVPELRREIVVIGDSTSTVTLVAGRVPVDGSGVTQPVSLAGNVTVIQPVAANLNATVVFSVPQHVIVDSATLGTVTVSGTVTANQGGAPWSQNLTQVGGSALSLGAKTSANSIPVVLATDEATLPVSIAGTVAVTQSTSPWVNNISQWGGTNVLTGGTAGSVGVGGLAAADAAQSGNPVLIGGVDNAGNVQELGVVDDGSNPPAQVVMVGGWDQVNAHRLLLSSSGAVALGEIGTGNDALTNLTGTANSFKYNILQVGGYLFNGTNWDKPRSAGAIGVAAVGGAAASGSAVSGNPVLIAGRTSAGNAVSVGVESFGTLSIGRSLTATDAVANTGVYAYDTGNNLIAPLNVYGYLFNGTSWDRVRSAGATGVAAVGGAAASGAAVSGNPVLVGGVNTAGNVFQIGVTSGGQIATTRGLTSVDGNSNLDGFLYDNNAGVFTTLAIHPQVFNGATWDRTRSAGIGNNVPSTGISIGGIYGQFNSTLPVVTSGNYTAIQTDASGRLITSPVTLPTGASTDANLVSGNDTRSQMMLILEATRRAIVALACEGGRNNPRDFDPGVISQEEGVDDYAD